MYLAKLTIDDDNDDDVDDDDAYQYHEVIEKLSSRERREGDDGDMRSAEVEMRNHSPVGPVDGHMAMAMAMEMAVAVAMAMAMAMAMNIRGLLDCILLFQRLQRMPPTLCIQKKTKNKNNIYLYIYI